MITIRSALWLIITMFVGESLFAYNLPKDQDNRREHDRTSLSKMSREIAEIASRARKAIVLVSTTRILKNPYGNVDPFEFFFGPSYRQRERDQRRRGGAGSGFIVDLKRGYILTNNHVVANADEITLKLANNDSYDGRVVGRDSNSDVAVIEVKDKKFKRHGLMALTLGDSGKVAVGDLAFALGAPFGLEASLSLGIISAVGRGNLNISGIGNFIQTDAAINPGNSGGPLLNTEGQVIGMNTAISTRSGGYDGIGFAIPSNLARKIAEMLINDGYVQRGYLGVRLQELTPDLHKSLRLPSQVHGVLISDVESDSPADRAGFRNRDVVVSVNGNKIKTQSELVNAIGLLKPGSRVTVKVYRDGRSETIQVTLGVHPKSSQPTVSANASNNRDRTFGMTLQKVTDSLRKRFRFESKYGLVVVDVMRNSPAGRSGLDVGDVLLSVNGTKIRDLAFFKKQLKSKTRPHVRVERQGNYFFVALRKK